ncbi:vacuolar ATP synthase subunit s1 (ATP6S1) domain-containing protein [Ditylenchus destructor]|nr:vacuolar ATP synthase subunit s1 (ATP6S1) domain-containing protein [Ditylenchus destructor]
MIRTCLLIAVLLLGQATTDEEVANEGKREKRVSSTANENPSADVQFPEDSKTLRFRSAKNRDDATGVNGPDYNFPIVLPPYNQEGASPGSPDPSWGTCLLYIESIAVIVFSGKNPDLTSAVAIVDGDGQKNKFKFGDGALSCVKQGEKAPQDFWFLIDVDVNSPAKATKGSDVLFTVEDPIRLKLSFRQNVDATWNLVDVKAISLAVKKGTWLAKDLSVNGGESSFNANRSMKIGGFNDYGYGCSSTPAAAWKIDNDYSVAVSFNNIQLQPFDIYISPDKKAVRFGRNVNDCVGLFSVASWMGVIVVLVMLGILAFGYLMLNSVQTMDRFDDPKQKQLIINAKE